MKTHTNSVSDINMDSVKAEGLCFPLLFPHGEPGYTNSSKSHLSPDEYVMAMMLRPEKIHGEYMTAQTSYAPFQCIDICTRRTICTYQRSLSGRSKSSVRCLNSSSSESKLFHVDGTAGPILGLWIFIRESLIKG